MCVRFSVTGVSRCFYTFTRNITHINAQLSGSILVEAILYTEYESSVYTIPVSTGRVDHPRIVYREL